MIKSFFENNHIEYKENISLKNYNTYRVDTICHFMVFPKDEQELIKILQEAVRNNLNYFILGNGSNTIFSMDYYDGIIVKLDKLNKITYNENIVTAEAGCSLIKLALDTIEKSLSGLVFATGIPGSVGASTAMNAGAYNSDMSNVIKEVKVLTEDYQIITMKNEQLKFSYRDSIIKSKGNLIVLSTTFELSKGNREEMKLQTEERRKKRVESQPLNLPNAGSVFRNPENMYAGELIEKCNLKGININGAEVSTKHANFIVNTGNATGKDIVLLIDKIKQSVKNKYNVELKLEQIIVK